MCVRVLGVVGLAFSESDIVTIPVALPRACISNAVMVSMIRLHHTHPQIADEMSIFQSTLNGSLWLCPLCHLNRLEWNESRDRSSWQISVQMDFVVMGRFVLDLTSDRCQNLKKAANPINFLCEYPTRTYMRGACAGWMFASNFETRMCRVYCFVNQINECIDAVADADRDVCFV